MPVLLLEDDGVEAPAFWRTVEIAPWSGDLRLKVRPSAKALLDAVGQRAKDNQLYRRHKETIDGETKTVNGDPDAAWMEEYLIAVVEDWDGVEGKPECSSENKKKLRAFPSLCNWISAESRLLAGIQAEDEEKN